MNGQELRDYLGEHLFYELQMLRFTYTKLRTTGDQPLWNALYESFGVHARNLYDFLRNEKDSRNFKASDFIDSFAVENRNGIGGLMQKMQQEILHLGKRRTATSGEKISKNDIEQIWAWIECGIEKFGRELPRGLQDAWKPDFAPPSSSAQVIATGIPDVSATFSVIQSSFSNDDGR